MNSEVGSQGHCQYLYKICCRLKLPKDRQEEDLHELVKQLPPGLSTSFNLGCLDIYPVTSGKSKAGIYLLRHFHNQPENSVLLCDDDNDLPLAAVVGRAFLPSITSNSVRSAMQAAPERFLASKKGGILATEGHAAGNHAACRYQTATFRQT